MLHQEELTVNSEERRGASCASFEASSADKVMPPLLSGANLRLDE